MKKYIYLLAITVIVFSGCSEKINVKLDDTYTRLVVEANLTTEYKIQTVKLTKTSSYFANEQAPTVSGAIVTITTDDTTMLFSETITGSGVYETSNKLKGKIGKTYTLHISNVGIETENRSFDATAFMRKTMNLDSVTIEEFVPSRMEMGMYRLKEGSTYYKINGWGQEDPTPGDFYLWDYYKNGKLQSDTIGKNVVVDDNLVNGNYIPGMTIFATEAQAGDTFTVATQSISKTYFDFYNALIYEVQSGGGGGMFSGPPANIIGNINNGGLGFFRATDVTFRTAIVK